MSLDLILSAERVRLASNNFLSQQHPPPTKDVTPLETRRIEFSGVNRKLGLAAGVARSASSFRDTLGWLSLIFDRDYAPFRSLRINGEFIFGNYRGQLLSNSFILFYIVAKCFKFKQKVRSLVQILFPKLFSFENSIKFFCPFICFSLKELEMPAFYSRAQRFLTVFR